MSEKAKPIECPYCQAPARLVDSEELYGRSYGYAWVCSKRPVCDAYVGCHPGTTKPLGRLADKPLRDAKMKAHQVFDPRWRNVQEPGRTKRQTRMRAYAWLATQLGITNQECHIGLFDLETCAQVVAVCGKANT